MRLDLVGIGPQRTATTWLYTCLLAHPQLSFPRGVKQTLFLDERFHKGWTWYWDHFQGRRQGQLCAEIAATYFDVPEAATRLYEHNPDCRILVTLRDPTARSFSEYLHHTKRGRLNCDFQTALQKMPRLREASRYCLHLERWIRLFGLEHMQIILQEDIVAAPQMVLERVYSLAGIPSIPPPQALRERVNDASLPRFRSLAKFATRGAEWLREHGLYGPIEFTKRLGLKRIYSNSRGSLPVLSPTMRQALITEFEPDIAYVEALLDRPLPGWRQLAETSKSGDHSA